MPCMPHFHDHYIPSTWVVLRQQDPTPAAAAAAPAEPVAETVAKAEAKLRQQFDDVIDGIVRVLSPFRGAYDAVVAFLTVKAAEELQARQELQPQTI